MARLPSGVDARTTQDAQTFNAKHPRDAGGRFSSNPGGGGARPAAKPQPQPQQQRSPQDVLRGRKLLGRDLRLKRQRASANLEANHSERFTAFLNKLPSVKAGQSLASAESFVWRARKMDDKALARERKYALDAAATLKKNGRPDVAASLTAHAKTVDFLLKNRERIRKMPKAEREVMRVHTKNRVEAWNKMDSRDRLSAAKKRAKWNDNKWSGDWPGKVDGYVMDKNGMIVKQSVVTTREEEKDKKSQDPRKK